MAEGKIYTEFSEWIQTREDSIKESHDEIKKTASMGWVKNKFSTQECEEAYLEMLKNNDGKVAGNIVVRHQYSHIKAAQRADRLQKEKIPRLLIHGYMENAAESNGLYRTVMTRFVKELVEQGKND
jgi:hypothetical protein